MSRFFLRLLMGLLAAVFFGEWPAAGQQAAPATTEGDFVVKNFQFRSGESLPELRLHYTTLGKPARDAEGRVRNAVLILHGTGGTGHQFLSPIFAGELSTPRATTSFFLTASATENPRSPATACTRTSRNTTTMIWSPRNTVCSPKAWA